MRSWHSLLNRFMYLLTRARLHCRFFIRSSQLSLASKMNLPVNRLNKIDPALNMSHLEVQPSYVNISGAIQPAVPHCFVSFSFKSQRIVVDIPKSAILTHNWSPSSILVIRIFSGFRSLWTIDRLCMKSNVNSSYSMINFA